jgi:uncharacterized protein (DUF924 family)/diadenosine tetraphosphate (Ap4A) HIT family hydrolase
VVYENEEVVAFLDHKPVFPGHVLLIPRRHVERLDQLWPSEVPGLFAVLRVLSQAVPLAMQSQGCFVANNNVVSQSVPHLHWHAVPRRKGDGLKGFFWPRHNYQDEQQRLQIASQLRDHIAQQLILDFWFGPPGYREQQRPAWFAQDPAFDATIGLRFGHLVEQALAGELQHWAESKTGLLALILLLDQFTRNLFRHTARAFAGDPQAQQLALAAVESGRHLEFDADERVFLYLPFEHGESSQWQELSLHHYAQLPPSHALYLDYAQRHARVIEQFGRYPHRNEVLARPSTPEEAAFLTRPESSFW